MSERNGRGLMRREIGEFSPDLRTLDASLSVSSSDPLP